MGKSLRAILRSRRRALSARTQRDNANTIVTRLLTNSFYKQARQIGVYLSIDGEVDLTPFITLLQRHGKRLYLPLVSDALRSWEPMRLLFAPFPDDASGLTNNQFGILEPVFSASACLDPQQLDLVLMPLVGFDRNGTRLGMGKGYYDRTFGRTNCWRQPRLVGIAHSCQEVIQLAAKPWDVPLDAVITELETLRFTNRALAQPH